MPDNITHLPTDETLANGLTEIANAIGKQFKLIKSSNTIVANSGAFVVPYDGDVPANFASNYTARILCNKKGVDIASLSYVISNVSTQNNTFVISTDMQYRDGICTDAVDVTILIKDSRGIIAACDYKIQNLPVDYAPVADPFGGLITVSDKTQATPFSATVYPQNVSPAVGLTDISEDMDAYITDTYTENIITYDTWDSQNISIPANTFDAAGIYEMFLVSPDQHTTIHYDIKVEA